MESEDRRKNDEAFKLKIVGDLAELKTKLQVIENHFDKYDNKLQESALKVELFRSDIEIKIDRLKTALIGDLSTKDGGLIGSQKALSVKVGMIIGGFVILGNFLISVAKDVVKKQLNEPIFSSKKR